MKNNVFVYREIYSLFFAYDSSLSLCLSIGAYYGTGTRLCNHHAGKNAPDCSASTYSTRFTSTCNIVHLRTDSR